MTVLALTELHSRKLIQARARTQQSVDLWRESVALVKKVEREAGCVIALPKQLIEDVSRAEESARTADYIMLLEIEKNAVYNRNQVYESALGTLQQDVKKLMERRGSDLQEIHKRQSAVSERSFVLTLSDALGGLLQIIIAIPMVFVGIALYPEILALFGMGGFAQVFLFLPYVIGLWMIAGLLSSYTADYLHVSSWRSITAKSDKATQQVEQNVQTEVARINKAIAQIEAHR